jgi:hypothetical protein
MPIAVPASRQALADKYATLGNYVGVCTGDPGATNVPANEAFGSGYVRVQSPWTSGSGGTLSGTAVTIDLPSGTFNYILIASASTGSTMIDKCSVPDTTLSSPGSVVVTPNYVQT